MAKPSRTEYVSLPVNVPNLSNWTVERVRCALTEHENGCFYNSAFLAEALERAPKTNAALNRRILTVLGLPFDLKNGDGDGRRDGPAVARIKPYWRKIASRRSRSKLLRWAISMGVAFGELVWSYERGDWIPRVKPWHPSFFHWDHTRGCYLAQTATGQVEVRPGENNWVIFSYDEWDDNPWMRGVVRCLGIPDAIRHLAVRDWARYSEIHGIPLRMLEVPSTGDEDEKAEVIAQVEQPANESTVIAPKGATEEESYHLSLVEPKDQAWEGFQRLIRTCDGDSALAILGIEMVNESGVYTPKDNSEGVRQDYTEADACALSDFDSEQVTRPWARYNLGENAQDSAPRAVYDATKPLDKKTASETVKNLGDGLTSLNKELRLAAKQQVKLADYLGRFDIPLEEAPEDSLSPTPKEQAQAEADAAKAKAQAAPAKGPQSKPPARAANVALARATGAPLVDGQAYVDDVVDEATRAAPEAFNPVLAAVLSEVSASTSYEDLRARLTRVLAGTESRKFRALLAAAIAMAQGAGVWSVEAERD
jgi:phage gp29-like protein